MMKTTLTGLALTACLFIASCGGKDISSTPNTPAQGTFPTSTPSEIDANNALLVARIANLAVTRYLAYRDLTATIYSRALSLSPSVPQTASCGGPSDGQLGISTLSATAFNVVLQACRASPDVVLNSGAIAVDSFSRSDGGASVSFNTTPNAIRVTDGTGTSTISGNISYHLALANTTSGAGQSEAHTGQLDYSQGGRTDQYRNIAITTGQITSGSTSSISVAVSKIEITTPRVAVSTIRVLTPGPLTFGTSPAPGSSDVLLAISNLDGSLVEVDYIGTTGFRLRAWDKDGKLLLDVTKNNADPDVVAADIAAVS